MAMIADRRHPREPTHTRSSDATHAPHSGNVTGRAEIGQERSQWRIDAATLAIAANRLDTIERFYLDELGLAGTRHRDLLQLSAGAAELRFEAASDDSEPFYHFALLVPGNRFAAARDWLAVHAALLARPESEETVFAFHAWNALACYAHDPAGNIVELIAHRGLEESPSRGAFGAAELRGISEVGIVTPDLLAALQELRAAGLELWSGEVSGPREGFAFVGRQAHTLILCPPGRPWLPTGRPAERHPLETVLGADAGGRIVVRVGHDAAVDAAHRP
jgi:catechol 2,3-dioxygenase-like lactoylglutathione lyase family enzyme